MKTKILALALLSVITLPAFASDRPIYMTVDFGTLTMTNAGQLPNPGAVDLAGGYRISQNIAIEAGYMIIGNSTVTVVGFGDLTLSQSAIHASGVFSWPLSESFDIYGKLGVNSINAKVTGTGAFAGTGTSNSTTNATYGVGAQFNFNKQFGARLQHEVLGKAKAQSTATGADLTRTSIGMVYSF